MIKLGGPSHGVASLALIGLLQAAAAGWAPSTHAEDSFPPASKPLDLDVAAGQTTLFVGEQTQLTVTALLDDGTTSDVTASVNGTLYLPVDPSIVSVSEEGIVTAMGGGNTTVIVQHPFGSTSIRLFVGSPTDADGDFMSDAFEASQGFDPQDPSDADADPDADGLGNLEELNRGTSPRDPDTDGDNVPDGTEVRDGMNPLKGFQLDENCTVSVLNRTVRINADGSFAIPNVPASSFLVRARAVCSRLSQVVGGVSGLFRPLANGTIDLPEIPLGVIPPTVESLTASVARDTLSAEGESSLLTIVGSFSDGAMRDLSESAAGTTYTSSNRSVAEVGPDGLITAGARSGTVIISITNDGVFTSKALSVLLAEVDSDGDGLLDDYESDHPCLDPGSPDAGGDPDQDALSSADEFGRGTEPCRADTDGDGLGDGQEAALGSDPVFPDTDLDGVLDGDEPAGDADFDGMPNVRDRDSDNDALPDGLEVRICGTIFCANPLADNDGDGLVNRDEAALFTGPLDPDSDDDGLTDGEEALGGSDPLVPDTAPPAVRLVAPAAGTTLIEGERITLAAEATDDGRVIRVEFIVDGATIGMDTSPPYEFPFMVPAGISQLTIEVAATDTNLNSGSSGPVDLPVTPDPLTDVAGLVLSEDDAPAAGAEVLVRFGQGLEFCGVAGSDGRFTLAAVATIHGDIVVSARLAPVGGPAQAGTSSAVAPSRGGITDVGTIRLSSAAFDADLGTDLSQGDDDTDFVAFTQGFTFPYFGTAQPGIFVNSNGNLTFGVGDFTFNPSVPGGVVNGLPRLAVLFTDLDPRFPGTGGGVFINQHTDRFVVTWNHLPQFSEGGDNTFQAILFSDGRIQFGYHGLTADGFGIGFGGDTLDLSVAISPGGTPPLRSVDYTSDAPFSTVAGEAILENFNTNGSFDLDGWFVVFQPNAGGGYDARVVAPTPNPGTAMVEVTVQDASGAPMAGCRLEASSSADPAYAEQAFSGPDGTFRFETVPVGGMFRLSVYDGSALVATSGAQVGAAGQVLPLVIRAGATAGKE